MLKNIIVINRKINQFRIYRIKLYLRLVTYTKKLDAKISMPIWFKYKLKVIAEKVFFFDGTFLFNIQSDLVNDTSARLNLNKTTIIIDGQCLRNSTFYRGIGRYTLSLIRHMAALDPARNYVLLTTNIGEIGNLIEVKKLINSYKLKNLFFRQVDVFSGKELISQLESERNLRDQIESLQPESIIVPSHFEHPLDCVQILPFDEIATHVIIHDLIPIQFAKDLLPSRKLRRAYISRIAALSNFTSIWSVSNFTKLVVEKYAGKNANIEVIGGSGFKPIHKTAPVTLKERSGIFCVGAETPHKNLAKLIEAYSFLTPQMRQKHSLNIAGLNSEGQRVKFQQISEKFGVDVNFLDKLTEKQLSNQYEVSRLVVVPSLAEGLSMPVMEGWFHKCLVIGSANTVLEEVINSKELLFDPYSAKDMSETMSKFLTDDKLWKYYTQSSLARLEIYDWDRVAFQALNSLNRNLLTE